MDERFNGGGDIADYVIDYLRRPIMGRWSMREGEDITVPMEGIFGPKVMIINEMAGSGGDLMPWLFRKSGIGPLVGMRTWGGLVGHYTGPSDLIDGGNVGTPNLAFYNLEGSWDVENHGVSPDYEVEMNPKLVREGHDPQLEKAVEVVLEQLKKNPVNYGNRSELPELPEKVGRSGSGLFGTELKKSRWRGVSSPLIESSDTRKLARYGLLGSAE